MLHLVESLGQRPGDTRAGALARDGLAAMLVLAVCCGTALAGDPPSPAEDQAGALADEVLRQAGGADEAGLGEWTRSIVERALDRVGEAAAESVRTREAAGNDDPLAPLPAERHAAAVKTGLSDRGGSTAEILIFMSLSVPAAIWRQWARDAARMDAPLVLRGVASEGFRATVKAIGDRLGGHEAGVAIDPRLFRLFGVERVPAVVVAPGGVPPCRSRGCADDPPPPHDRVTGNISLAAAMETIAAEGEAGRDVARVHLEHLGGER